MSVAACRELGAALTSESTQLVKTSELSGPLNITLLLRPDPVFIVADSERAQLAISGDVSRGEPDSVTVDDNTLGRLLQAAERVGVADVTAQLDEFVHYLEGIEDRDPFSQRLPGLFKRISEIELVEFAADEFKSWISGGYKSALSLLGNPTTLQQLESSLELLQGFSGVRFSFLEGGTGDGLRLDLQYAPPDVATEFPLALDLTSLGVDLVPLGLDAVGFVVADQAGTPIQVEAGGLANLALELDLSDAESLSSFLLDGTSVELDIRAVGDALSFSTPLCALAANVTDGTFRLDTDGADSSDQPAHLQAYLAAGARLPLDAAAAASILTVQGLVDIELPFTFSGGSLEPLIVEKYDLSTGTSVNVSGPNVAELQAGLDLRDNLDALRVGFPRLFEELDRVLDAQAFSRPLPLVGTQLAVAADFIDQLVAKVSDNLAGSTETLVPERLRKALWRRSETKDSNGSKISTPMTPWTRKIS